MLSLRIGILFLLSLVFVSGKHRQKCDPGPADVMFVLSSDDTLDSQEFLHKMHLVKDFVNSVNIGRDNVRVGMITEYNFADLEFLMNDHLNKQELMTAIDFVYYQGGRPSFGSGLGYITEHGMDTGLGGRPGVPDVVIFLTDGIPGDTNLAQSQVDKLTAAGATVIALGAGNMDKSDLIDVASGCHYVSQQPRLDYFDLLVDGAVNLTCDALNGVPLDECECDLTADVVFLLDASSAQGKDNFKKQLNFTQSVVSELNIASNETKVAAVTYSTFYHYQFGLDSHVNKSKLELALSFIPFQSDDDRYAEGGLAFIKNNMSFIPGIPSRSRAEKIVVLTATGPLSDPDKARVEALRLKNLGATVFFAPIGGHNNALDDIATNQDHVMHFDSFDQMVASSHLFAKKMCQDKKFTAANSSGISTSPDACNGLTPCLNGGTCVNVMGAKSCQCPQNYGGHLCQTALTPTANPSITMGTTSKHCKINPCRNGGTCIVVGDMYQCRCTHEFTGLQCQDGVITTSKTPQTTQSASSQRTSTANPTTPTIAIQPTTTKTTIPTTTSPKCPQFDERYWPCSEAEVIFMIENSRTDNGRSLEHQGSFIRRLIGKFKVDPQHVRVGVATYNDRYRQVIDLADYMNDTSGLNNRIEQLTNGEINATGGADFPEALAFVMHQSFVNARPDVPKVIISVNHQEPQGNLLQNLPAASHRLRDDCIHLSVHAVTVSDKYKEKLLQLPLFGYRDHSSYAVLEIDGYSEINQCLSPRHK